MYLAAARERDLRITQVVETHLHNDYVSGGRELAALTGASHRIGAGAELRHEHEPVRHGESFDVGDLRFTALDTPGHTPEHVSYAVADRSRAEEPVLLMTGGSLLVGAVGRTDLLGAEHAVPYAQQMYRSLHDVLLPHEDFVGVYPTHGAGSLCSTGIASTPRSTIGYERRHNALLGPMDVDAFARALLSGQPTFPRYFARMRPTNQAGPRLLGATIPASRPLGLDEVRAAIERGALVVDARAPTAWTSAHVPASVSIPAGSSFGTWLGWVVDPDRPTILVLEHAEDADDLMRQAFRVGHETIVGHVAGGFRTWVEAGLPIEFDRSPDRRRAGGSPGRGPGRGAIRARRAAGERVRGWPRPRCAAPHRRDASRRARDAAPRQADRRDVRIGLSLVGRGIAARPGRVRARLVGRRRRAGVARRGL